jgi:3-dehydroquinate synthetase
MKDYAPFIAATYMRLEKLQGFTIITTPTTIISDLPRRRPSAS